MNETELRLAYDTQCTEIISLRERVSELEVELAQLKEQLNLRKQRQFGKKTEADHSDSPSTGTQTVASYTRSKRGRGSRFDISGLPRHTVIHDLPEEQKQCTCCKQALHVIGQEVAEQVEIIPARYCVIEHVRMKYGCRACDKIVMADKPMAPIPKCAAGASLLTDVLVNRYFAHLPLYRQAKLMHSQQLLVPDNTLGNWVMKSGEALMMMHDALWGILKQRYLQVDETPVTVLESDKKGYIWSYYAPHVGSGLVVFEFSETRAGAVAEARLHDFNGLLQTDGYNGYVNLRKQKPRVIGLGCITHARRKFDEVIKISGDHNGIAAEMLKKLQPLYYLEAHMRTLRCNFHTKKRLRQKVAYPQLTEIHRWLKQQRHHVLLKSQLGKAIDYTLKQWPYLIAYTRHGMAEIDTNYVENKIREIALGRRNWLFIGNPNSGKIHALFYSLVLSCVLNKLNPRVYLHYLLTQVHKLRKKEIDPTTLLPDRIDREKINLFIEDQISFAKKFFNTT